MDRQKIGFALGGLAILLRMSSDWFFAAGGPRWYEVGQFALLLLGAIAVWPNGELILLRGGSLGRSVRPGLWGFPLGVLAGLGDAWLSCGGPRWPAPDRLLPIVVYNLFFPVEVIIRARSDRRCIDVADAGDGEPHAVGSTVR